MLVEKMNLKDSSTDRDISITDTPVLISYTKTQKLITALYMVTDIIDKEEPIRNKLRSLGADIISDINSTFSNTCNRISEIMSFLNIASAIKIISEMNCNILRKEFLELNESILESVDKSSINHNKPNRQINLSEFFEISKEGVLFPSRGLENDKGHTRIGVQKGSTLMQALSDRSLALSMKGELSDTKNMTVNPDTFNVIKKQRRDEILNIIKFLGAGATIKDIKDRAQLKPEEAVSLISCGEKTLQRELLSMTKDGVLNKAGKKRWSRYFVKTLPV